MAQDTAIGITGIKATKAALRAFRPDIEKRLNAEIRKALGTTLAAAKGNYPDGAWKLVLNQRKLLGSIMATPGKRIDNNWGASDPGVKAAIFEFAGSRGMGATPQARGLIESLNRRYGQPGRFLWAAWDKTGKDVLDRIRTAMLEAERDLQATLDSAGEDY